MIMIMYFIVIVCYHVSLFDSTFEPERTLILSALTSVHLQQLKKKKRKNTFAFNMNFSLSLLCRDVHYRVTQ